MADRARAELIREFLGMLKEHFQDTLCSVCLYGSVARDEAKSESDIDLLVVADGLSQDLGLRYRETNDIRLRLKSKSSYKRLRMKRICPLISDLYLTPEEVERHPPILLDLVEDGVILYDREDFLKRVLDDIRRMTELGSRRVDRRYWILAPHAKFGEEIRI